MKHLPNIVTGIALSLTIAGMAMAQDYDLVIVNSRVIDPNTDSTPRQL